MESYKSPPVDLAPIPHLSDRWQWKRDVQKSSFQTIQKRNRLKIRSYPRYGEHGEKMFVFIGLQVFVHAAVAAEVALLHWKLSRRWSKTVHATIGLRSRHRNNPRPTRFVSGKAFERRLWPRRYRVDPWSRLREVARGVLRSYPKPEKRPFFLPSERDREFFVACFLHSSAQMCLYQTPGRRRPPVTGRFVNTVTKGWVGAPNERAPLRFHGAVVGLVHRCLSRTRNLAASSKIFGWVFLRPILAQSAQDFF